MYSACMPSVQSWTLRQVNCKMYMHNALFSWPDPFYHVALKILLFTTGTYTTVHVSAHDKNSTHTIWHITTGQLSETSSKRIEPNYLEAGTAVLNLVPYTHPIRCTFCQSLEHTKFDCWAEYSSCVFCAGHHSAEECGQRWRHKCANCLGPHKASDPACPEVKAKRAKQGLPQLSTKKSEGHKHSIPVPTCSNSSTETSHRDKPLRPHTKRDLQKHTKQETFPLFSLRDSQQIALKHFSPLLRINAYLNGCFLL